MLTLLTLLVVAAAAGMPMLVFRWQDSGQLGRYTPLQQAGGTLYSVDSAYYISVIRDNSVVGDAPVERTITDKNEIQALLNENFALQIQSMADNDLLSAEIASAIYAAFFEQDNVRINVAFSMGVEHQRKSFEVFGDAYRDQMRIVIDDESNRIIGFSAKLFSNANQSIDTEKAMQQYIKWLQLTDVTDWYYIDADRGNLMPAPTLAPESIYSASDTTSISITNNYRSVVSEQAGIRLNVGGYYTENNVSLFYEALPL